MGWNSKRVANSVVTYTDQFTRYNTIFFFIIIIVLYKLLCNHRYARVITNVMLFSIGKKIKWTGPLPSREGYLQFKKYIYIHRATGRKTSTFLPLKCRRLSEHVSMTYIKRMKGLNRLSIRRKFLLAQLLII